MSQETRRALRSFLDLEAGVDDDDDEVGGGRSDDEEFDDFIDNDNPAELGEAKILERSVNSGVRNLALREPTEHPDDAFVQVRMPPTSRDFPLWRVACRLGIEEEAVFSLLQLAAPWHELRSAFTRGSIRGWVYLETTMNEHINRLLKLTPGIVSRRTGIIREQIDFEDWTKMLTMHDIEANVDVGRWVRVRKGTYKGDVGYVLASESWGVRLLLVPRLSPPNLASSSLKRKRSTVAPEPA
ncbi:hypothetical protein K443DRAFT_2099, partial [Laccaria amethystina LaAM-08-1]